jgi:hypothetical protein
MKGKNVVRQVTAKGRFDGIPRHSKKKDKTGLKTAA